MIKPSNSYFPAFKSTIVSLKCFNNSNKLLFEDNTVLGKKMDKPLLDLVTDTLENNQKLNVVYSKVPTVDVVDYDGVNSVYSVVNDDKITITGFGSEDLIKAERKETGHKDITKVTTTFEIINDSKSQKRQQFFSGIVEKIKQVCQNVKVNNQ
jgi:hypothetical protein